MSFISYAQNFEDVMLWRALKHIENGFYIDVGANDPNLDSVTHAFYHQGWRGINVEPLLTHFNDLNVERPRDINLNCALSDNSGELNIWECEVRGWATFDINVAKFHEANGYKGQWHKVAVKTLADVCVEYQSENIHFLKVDVEGFELAVLKGNDWDKYRPWIVVVEATLPNTQIEKHSEIEGFLIAKNYIFAYADGLNRFYVAKEHKELLPAFKYPPNVFDDFKSFEWQTVNEQLVQEQARIELLKMRAEQAEFRVEQAEFRVEQAEFRVEQAEFRVEQAEFRVEQAEARVEIAEVRAENAEVRAEQAEVRAEQEEFKAAVSEQSKLQLVQQLDAVYASTSWRISAPLRLISSVFQAIFFKNSKRSSSGQQIVKKIIGMTVATLNRHPTFRTYVLAFLKKIKLYNRMRGVYQRLKIAPVETSVLSINHNDLLDVKLSPYGKAILDKLNK